MSVNKREEFRQDTGPCALCGRIAYNVYGGGAMKLKDGSNLCGSCVRRVRFLYPVQKPQLKKGMIVRDDPLSGLTAEEVRAAAEQAGEKLEALRERYSFHNAVFRVDAFSAEKQGLFKAPKNAFSGYVLYGRFNLGERVRLIHGNAATEITLEDIGDLYPPGRPGEAGYASVLYAVQKGLDAQPGDLIVKD
jgi:hypothetical protein